MQQRHCAIRHWRVIAFKITPYCVRPRVSLVPPLLDDRLVTHTLAIIDDSSCLLGGWSSVLEGRGRRGGGGRFGRRALLPALPLSIPHVMQSAALVHCVLAMRSGGTSSDDAVAKGN